MRAEKRLLDEAYAVVGLPSGLAHAEKLRRAFVAGDIIPANELRTVTA